jgi:hypothetical protein
MGDRLETPVPAEYLESLVDKRAGHSPW